MQIGDLAGFSALPSRNAPPRRGSGHLVARCDPRRRHGGLWGRPGRDTERHFGGRRPRRAPDRKRRRRGGRRRRSRRRGRQGAAQPRHRSRGDADELHVDLAHVDGAVRRLRQGGRLRPPHVGDGDDHGGRAPGGHLRHDRAHPRSRGRAADDDDHQAAARDGVSLRAARTRRRGQLERRVQRCGRIDQGARHVPHHGGRGLERGGHGLRFHRAHRDQGRLGGGDRGPAAHDGASHDRAARRCRRRPVRRSRHGAPRPCRLRAGGCGEEQGGVDGRVRGGRCLRRVLRNRRAHRYRQRAVGGRRDDDTRCHRLRESRQRGCDGDHDGLRQGEDRCRVDLRGDTDRRRERLRVGGRCGQRRDLCHGDAVRRVQVDPCRGDQPEPQGARGHELEGRFLPRRADAGSRERCRARSDHRLGGCNERDGG